VSAGLSPLSREPKKSKTKGNDCQKKYEAQQEVELALDPGQYVGGNGEEASGLIEIVLLRSLTTHFHSLQTTGLRLKRAHSVSNLCNEVSSSIQRSSFPKGIPGSSYQAKFPQILLLLAYPFHASTPESRMVPQRSRSSNEACMVL
jgi:hypothetical protein